MNPDDFAIKAPGKPGGIYVTNGTDSAPVFVGRLYTTGGEGAEGGPWSVTAVLAILLRAHRDDPVFAAELERAGLRVEWEDTVQQDLEDVRE